MKMCWITSLERLNGRFDCKVFPESQPIFLSAGSYPFRMASIDVSPFICLHSSATRFNARAIHGKTQLSVSKYVINGSKTVVMNVIGFLCLWLGSSTIQLHENLGSRLAYAYSEAGFSSEIVELDWRLYCRGGDFFSAFFVVKRLNVNTNIHTEMCPVCGGKCLPRKAVHNWVEEFSQRFSKVADCARPGRSVEIATGKSGWDNRQNTSIQRVSRHW